MENLVCLDFKKVIKKDVRKRQVEIQVAIHLDVGWQQTLKIKLS